MKCLNCKEIMDYKINLRFDKHLLRGWKCNECGERYYDSEQAERILLMNKLKKRKQNLL